MFVFIEKIWCIIKSSCTMAGMSQRNTKGVNWDTEGVYVDCIVNGERGVDVAFKYGISASMVSRFLNGKTRIAGYNRLKVKYSNETDDD